MPKEDRPLRFAEIVAMEQDSPLALDGNPEQFARQLAAKNFYGLAISGGGIRVATFALGILQYLATYKLLSPLDYLSTVSGGGYIGSFFSAWCMRERSIREVEERLVPLPPREAPAQTPRPMEDPALLWLRQFGKYLAPQTSLFSADTWLIGTIWVRNTLLNLILLVTMLAVVLLTPWVLLGIYKSCACRPPHEMAWILAGMGTLAAACGLRYKGGWEAWCGGAAAVFIVLSSVMQVFATRHVEAMSGAWPFDTIAFPLGIILGGLAGYTMLCETPMRLGVAVRLGLCMAAGGFGLPTLDLVIGWMSDSLRASQAEFLVPIVVPHVVAIQYSVLVTLFIGFAGRCQADDLREWWSRVGAWMAILGFSGLLLAGVSVAGPALFFFVKSEWSLILATSGIWTLATGAGVLLGRSSKTTGDEHARRPILDKILPLAPPIFMGGFLVLAATAVYLGLFGWVGANPLRPGTLPSVTCFVNCGVVRTAPPLDELWAKVWGDYASAVNQLPGPEKPILATLFVAGLFLLLSRLFDLNGFSQHQFYRTRLVRAYLGASRGRARRPDAFTNIDPADDPRITELRPPAAAPGERRAWPIHLVNTAVNLNLASTGLDERRAASFVFTPYACGYSIPNCDDDRYRAYTDLDSDLRLGTPMTISGAAASPNMGYHTAPTVAFLMTIFNVRLGYWMFNTAAGVSRLAPLLMRAVPVRLAKWFKLRELSQWSARGPLLGSFYYLFELFGIADGGRKFVYLSDGGHFENMAVYELLRRRVRHIICIDGEEDAQMKFEGLGGLIRKARSDLGVEITIDTSGLEERSAEGWSNRHCAVASIHYPEPGAAPGTLLYLKLSVTGDEPIDILHYRKLNPEFPHQSTIDQFFSESQFESYRALGFHVAETAFRPVDLFRYADKPGRVDSIFEDLRQFWTGLPRNVSADSGRNTEQLISLLNAMREDNDLWYLNRQFDARWGSASAYVPDVPDTDPAYTKGFYLCQQLIQLMENVYVDADLEVNYDHPVFAGWTEQFRRWARSPMFQHTYELSKDTFGPLFRNFYRRRIAGHPPKDLA